MPALTLRGAPSRVNDLISRLPENVRVTRERPPIVTLEWDDEDDEAVQLVLAETRLHPMPARVSL